MKSIVQRLEDLELEMNRTVESASVDAVHNLRVAVRRASTALRLFEARIPRARRIRKEIQQIREKAATVRDRDVTRQLLRRHHLPASDPACVYLQGQRDLAAAQLHQFLFRKLRKDRPRRWRRWVGGEA